ncbi:calmodulin-binding protein 60 A isoform X3 [Lactuca sativa]|uniref:calmodulin-binding protein 60 A isoform X3 n=1 Tax=Lactuca sativa TaxID=4236 RepID=UPI0022AEF73D|nr:calmodulin-binding protein 60 A isoform X3 [Lactuca sativa]
MQDYEASASSTSAPINLKLIFSDDVVVSPVFTRQKITGKNGGNESIKVILVDADTQEEVTTGPMAFSKVKIVLLRGNYDGTTMEDGEFEKNIVVNWGKKKNLLVGDVYVHLRHGTGTVDEIRIQHDKNPIRNVELRLGAMVVDSSCPYEVKQAITQSFKVKDRRNAPKSFRSLSPTDKVWQLKNISKNGVIHKRLERANVYNVNDFLNMYYSNRQALQEISHVKGKKWETTVNHAKTCNVGNANYKASGRLESTTQESNIPSSFDDDCYFPQPYENDSFDHVKEMIVDDNKEEMIVDDNFSIHDVEECDMDVWFHEDDEGSLLCQDSREDGICRALSMVEFEGVKAKKRWMKMRTLLFSIACFSFMCGCELVG